MSDFYSDNDPGAVAWLIELVKAELIPTGTVDERPIQEITAADLAGYRQCHFFAGIGGWPYALRLAGWPESRPVWTGSCPCQPFSAAGKGKGEADKRHLWPAWLALIRECRPDCLFGEQVGSRDGYRWFDGVRTDLESEGYAVGAADLPAACVGSPHVRQRLFWCAKFPPDLCGERLEGRTEQPARQERQATERSVGACDSSHAGCAGVRSERQSVSGTTRGNQSTGNQRQRFRPDAGNDGNNGDSPNNASNRRRQGRANFGRSDQRVRQEGNSRGPSDNLGNGDLPDTGHAKRGRAAEQRPNCEGQTGRDQEAVKPGLRGANGLPSNADGRESSDRGLQRGGQHGQQPQDGRADARRGSDFWSDFDIIHYRDGKTRRVEPPSQCVADGIPDDLVEMLLALGNGFTLTTKKIAGRTTMLRGFGNAIVPQVAAKFIRAFLETERDC